MDTETPLADTISHHHHHHHHHHPHHHNQSDSLVSVSLTEPSLYSPLVHVPTEFHQDDAEDEEHMAALLARLEMENNALATDPKAGISTVTSPVHDRYASMGATSLFSVHIPPEALGMSLGDFWAFVTRDYKEALSALPTMTPVMIHKGVPDFLRPVVWVGMAGARDDFLYAEFDRLLAQVEHEAPTTDSIIDKDIGRCFPSHSLFAEAGGEGQTMLGQVLKCYNLYDSETGYCQGMGFIVGILLMKMDARDAFCVFVRLMQDQGLRSCYSHSLTGLHSRIYQFQQLVSPLAPALVAHFQALGVEFAYLSQWFMTIFATTCPLDTLFRVYDVVLAEGADETIMRVALALILKNEDKLVAMDELEDVLQLLLSRDIWEPYTNNPDQLIEEVTTLFNQVVTREALDKLDNQFLKKAEKGSADKTVRALGFTSTYGNAFRLLDFWWAPKTRSLSPNSSLRRTASKQSLATLNSSSGADSFASSTNSYASTAPTEIDREDSATPTKMQRSFIQHDRNLHEQVEGLLLALTEVQREAAQTAVDLQKEQSRRLRAQEIVTDLLELFRQKTTVDAYRKQRRTTLPSRITDERSEDDMKELRRRSNFVRSVAKNIMAGDVTNSDVDAGLHSSLLKLCALFDAEESLSLETDVKSEDGETTPPHQSTLSEYTVRLESELTRLRQRVAKDRTHRHNRRTLELKEARLSLDSDDFNAQSAETIRVRRSLYRKQNHRKSASREISGQTPDITISLPRVRPRQDVVSPLSATRPGPPLRMIRSQDGTEMRAMPQKFGKRKDSVPFSTPTYSKRTSSLVSQNVLATPDHEPPADDTLLIELVSAKTREATAIHERDEMKVQLDRTRRQFEAREAEMKSRLESMEAMMMAQLEAHGAEMERLKSMMMHRPDTPSSIGPSPMNTPELLNTPAPKGWGWFGRSVSPTM